jgi:hypothetical protein
VADTVAFIQNEGFFSYSEYFLSENMNGRMLLLVNKSHLPKMPEQNDNEAFWYSLPISRRCRRATASVNFS